MSSKAFFVLWAVIGDTNLDTGQKSARVNSKYILISLLKCSITSEGFLPGIFGRNLLLSSSSFFHGWGEWVDASLILLKKKFPSFFLEMSKVSALLPLL